MTCSLFSLFLFQKKIIIDIIIFFTTCTILKNEGKGDCVCKVLKALYPNNHMEEGKLACRREQHQRTKDMTWEKQSLRSVTAAAGDKY